MSLSKNPQINTILVTGGFGYVGSRLVPQLVDLGYRVRVLDLCLYSDAGKKALGSRVVEHVQKDIRDTNAVRAALQGVDAIIHLAAISNDPTGQLDELLTKQVNFDAVGQLVALAKASGVKRFINGSSSSVFGVKPESNITEVLEPEPITFYSKYKMLSEWILLAAASPEFCAVNIRPATICGYSPRQRFDLTVNKLTADALTKGVITVHGGQQRRPNVGISDMIHLYASLLAFPAELINGRTYNFGFENLKVIEIAELIQKEFADKKVRIDIVGTNDNRDYHISSQKLLRELGYKPVSSIRNEVRTLREKIEAEAFGSVDDPSYYNMQTMKLERSGGSYRFLAGEL